MNSFEYVPLTAKEKLFRPAMFVFNAIALLIILGISELDAPNANADPYQNTPFKTCVKYADSDQAGTFINKFNSCANVLNIQYNTIDF